jgi:murein DD-endopeptidase MepM/ murein hydrolase activator NlpD
VVQPGGQAGTAERVEEEAGPQAPPVADPGRLVLEGTSTQGGLLFGRAEPGAHVHVGRKPIRVSKDGRFLVPLRRGAVPSVTLEVEFADGAVLERELQIEQRDFETDVVDGLPEELVNPDKETRRDLRRSQRRIEKIRARYRDQADYEGGFEWPLRGRITAGYGAPRVINGEKRGVHWGVDIAAPVGRKIRAPAAGRVVFAEADVPLAGTTVIIDHGHRLTSSFLHLNKLAVKVGDRVEQGDVIGRVGRTGRATGSHLDWRMNVGKTRIDPALLVPPMKKKEGRRAQ